MSLRDEAIALVKQRGYERRDQPFRLASGEMSHDYIDGKYAVDTGARLNLVAHAVVDHINDLGVDFNSVGGLTMGADALAHGISMVADIGWFSVRKEPKPRGREQWIEGARLGQGDRVLLVDDIVTMGGSIKTAYDRVLATGAEVVAVAPMVDRGDAGRALFDSLGVLYAPLMNYVDLGIAPVGPALTPTSR